MSCGAKCIDIVESGRARRACGTCRRVYYHNPFPGVALLVVDGDRFLMGRRSQGLYGAGTWSLPSGYIEFDEDFLTGGRREVLEETGIEVAVESLLSVHSNFLNFPFVVPVLLARPVGGRLSPSEETDEVAWFDRSGPWPDMAFEGDPHIIERYFLPNSGVPSTPGSPRTSRTRPASPKRRSRSSGLTTVRPAKIRRVSARPVVRNASRYSRADWFAGPVAPAAASITAIRPQP
jgi:8-oxo-dGTP pyrophosphatase MutT (NUDIX family)